MSKEGIYCPPIISISRILSRRGISRLGMDDTIYTGWTIQFAMDAWLDNTAFLVMHINRRSGYIDDQQYY
jgi:hypothetical protein